MRPGKNDNASGKAGEVGAFQKIHLHFNRFPAYGKQLNAMRRAGKIPARLVIVTFDWKLARAYPRIVLADDTAPAEINFSFLAGLQVQVVYRLTDAHRVNAVVEAILKVNPSFLATFAVDRVGEEGARALIIPYQEIQTRAAA